MTNCHNDGRSVFWRHISNHLWEGRRQSVQCSVYFWCLLSIYLLYMLYFKMCVLLLVVLCVLL